MIKESTASYFTANQLVARALATIQRATGALGPVVARRVLSYLGYLVTIVLQTATFVSAWRKFKSFL